MKISVFAGDLCDVRADALCTSTNPRLSLVMGTGASVLGRGGYQILRACEAIVEAESGRSGTRGLIPGSAHATIAGTLPAKVIVHCVASDAAHRSSAAIIRSCVRNALALAEAAGCKSIAMPVFGTGHAHFAVDQALLVMAETLRDEPTRLEHVYLALYDCELVDDVVGVLRSTIPSAEIDVQTGTEVPEEAPGMWSPDWGDRYGI
ncbi:MAG: macro domain-containing protein [Acidobacteriota bacterium]